MARHWNRLSGRVMDVPTLEVTTTRKQSRACMWVLCDVTGGSQSHCDLTTEGVAVKFLSMRGSLQWASWAPLCLEGCRCEPGGARQRALRRRWAPSVSASVVPCGHTYCRACIQRWAAVPSFCCGHPEPHTRLPGGRLDPPLNLGGNVEEITACIMVCSVQIH